MVGLDVTTSFFGVPISRSSKKLETKEKSATVPFTIAHPHSRLAESLLSTLAVGTLETAESVDDPEAVGEGIRDSQVGPGTVVPATQLSMNKVTFKNFALTNRTNATPPETSHPVVRLTFALHRPDELLIVKPGQCVMLQFPGENGDIVTRPYTPIHSKNQGSVDFYVKITGGIMTAHLKECKSIRMRGPITHVDALNPGRRTGCWDTLGMIAGGSGKYLFFA